MSKTCLNKTTLFTQGLSSRSKTQNSLSTVQDFYNGKMVLDMKESLETIKLTELGDSSTTMETFTRVNLEKTRQMERGLISIALALSTLAVGEMTRKTVSEGRIGMMAHTTKDISRMV